MLVLPPRVIPQLAERIENAYYRRRPRAHREFAHSGVWSAAAQVLVALHRSDSALPIDPELYVAAQLASVPARIADPWSELVHPSAAARYRRQVRHIIVALRRELRSELRVLRRRGVAGSDRPTAPAGPGARVSPLSCFIAAYRDHGPEVAEVYREPARRQHEACPLYRQACATLLPPDAYPVLEDLTAFRTAPAAGLFSLN